MQENLFLKKTINKMIQLLFLGYSLAMPLVLGVLISNIVGTPSLFRLVLKGSSFISLIIYILLVLVRFNFITI